MAWSDAIDPTVLLRGAAIVGVLLLALGVTWGLMRTSAGRSRDAMSPWEHVEELRARILWSTLAWLLATAAMFSLRIERMDGWPVPIPAIKDNIAAQVFQRIADHLVPDGVELVVTRPIDGFLAELVVAAALGFILALPVLLVQAAGFFGPALKAKERRALRNAVLPALALFALGAWFAWQWVLPFLLTTLYGYSEALGATSLLVVGDLISFTVTLILVFGLSFQLPLVMYVLARVGLVSAGGFRKYWRHAAVGILVFSAFVTDPTVISQLMVAGPLMGLYVLGMGLARVGQRRALDNPEPTRDD